MDGALVWLVLLLAQAALLGLWWWRSSRVDRGADELAQMIHMVRMLRLEQDAVCVTDAHGCLRWANAAHAELTGLNPEALGQCVLADWLREHAESGQALRKLEEALRSRSELRTDLKFCYPQGLRWTVLELHPVHDMARQRFLGFVLVQIDIDRQRRSSELMKRLVRDHQALMDILDQYAIVSETDLQGTITRSNPRFTQISGYSAEELLGQNHRLLNSGHHDERFWQQMWATVSAGDIWRGEVCNRAKDGSLYWMESVIAPLLGPDGLPARYVSIRTDITPLMHNQILLERTGQFAKVGGWYSYIATRTLHFSREARAILQLKGETFIVEEVLELFPPQAREELWANVARVTRGEAQAFSQTVRLPRPGSSDAWLRMTGEMESQDGRPYRLIGAVQDITDLVDAQMRTQASERLLSSAIDALDEAFAVYDEREKLIFVNEKYRDITSADGLQGPQRHHFKQRVQLNNGRWIKYIGNTTPDGLRVVFGIDITDIQQALDAADAASRSKSQFLANMSHEIRTPMNAVLGMLQLMQHTALDADQADLLGKMGSAARTLLGLLNDILDFSKIEAGKMTLDVEPFDLDALLTEISTLLSSALGDKALELIFDIDPAIPRRLRGDALRIKQILINLGGNAIKFTASGQVLLRVRQLRRDARGCLLEFAVHDTGIGISAEQCKNLFVGFSQADASITRRFGGTGLGLAIAQRLVAAMNSLAGGGQPLSVESRLGQGSCFAFQLLLEPDACVEDELPVSGAVWLLEPHPVSRDAIARMLDGMGWQVSVFADQAELLAQPPQPVPMVALLGIDAMPSPMEPNIPQTLLIAGARGIASPQGRLVLRKPLTAGMVRAALQRSQTPSAPALPPTAGQRLAGLRLLLAEDNRFNQEVALRMLRGEGAQVDLAENGQQALDALQAQSYDLVLMDMQMPVLDGPAATRAIRQRPEWRGLPIIAMTANVMPADRSVCQEAGMDDHLGKPFDREELMRMVLRHTRGAAAVEAMPAAAALAQDKVLDAQTALARLGDDLPFYIRLLGDFEPAARALLAPILATEGRAGDAAHQLKTLARTVGAQKLGALAAEIEQALRADSAAMPDPAQCAALSQALDEALAAQAEWLRQQGSATAVPATGNARSLQEQLNALADALARNDMEALDLFDELAQHPLDGPEWEALQAAMDVFDTETAQAALHALIARHKLE